MHPNGAFYSAEDADSEGIEGKFYVWEADELRELLLKDYDFVDQHFQFMTKEILRMKQPEKNDIIYFTF